MSHQDVETIIRDFIDQVNQIEQKGETKDKVEYQMSEDEEELKCNFCANKKNVPVGICANDECSNCVCINCLEEVDIDKLCPDCAEHHLYVVQKEYLYEVDGIKCHCCDEWVHVDDVYLL